MYSDRNEGNATYALNSYTWKLLEANLGWKKSDYKGGVAIIPNAQQPELKETGKPFITYGSAVRPANHLYVLREEALAYNVYSSSSTEVNKIINLLSDTFVRQDDAARDVNEWLTTEQAGRGFSREVFFTSIRVSMSERAEPAEGEGGFTSGFVLMDVQYIPGETDIQTSGFLYTV